MAVPELLETRAAEGMLVTPSEISQLYLVLMRDCSSMETRDQKACVSTSPTFQYLGLFTIKRHEV
jgi:hypothetical protein